MPGDQIRLLSLDGGGVRGLSSLMILRRLMATVDPESPPKPCEYFDMIGGTSTGGLIAIMLGRLQMTVDECIEAYTSLSDKVFEKKSHRVKINGKLQGRFDTAELEETIKRILRARNLHEDELLKDIGAPCKVFVCATSKQTSDTVCLASYRSPRSDNSDLLSSTKIWQAGRATSAATGFFDPIVIGPFDEEFVDGALGANNPIYVLWNQAQDVWGVDLQNKLQCVVSIGTGVPNLKPVRDDVLGIWATLKDLATETEKTAQQFHRDKSSLDNEGRYYRFNVDHGLEEIGLEESKKKKEIAAATRRYFESQTVFKQMQACANSLSGREYNVDWLLIFDNVDQDYEQGGTTGAFDIRRYLPGDHGAALITTRLSQLAQLGNSKHAKQLKKADETLSKAVFEKWYGGQLDTAGRELLGLLDGLPLALAQAAAYRRETGLDVTSYVRLYKQQWDDLMTSDTESGSPLMDYDQRSIGTTWTISFKAIETRSKNAANLLRLWAFIANKDLWYGLLQAAAVSQEDEQWPEWLREIAYTEAKFINTGRLPEAEAMFLRALQGYEKALEPDHTSALTMVNNLGNLYRNQGRLPEAEAMFLRALQGYEKALGPDHTSALTTVNNLGNLYRDQGRLPEAEAMFLRALQGKEKALGPDHTSTLNTVGNLGNLYRDQGRLSEAEAMYQRALQGKEKALGPDHISTLNTVGNLGLLYRNQGRLSEAEAMYQRALQGKEKTLGPDYISTLNTVGNLGLLYRDQGRLSEAEAMHQRALQGKEKTLGPDHTSALTTVNNLGLLYRNQDRLSEAEAMYQRALQGYEKALGPDHTSALTTVNNLGNLYRDQGRLLEAEAMFLRALQGYEKALGPDHTSVLTTVNNLGNLYRNQGRLLEAEAMFLRALQGYEKALGRDHTSTLNTVGNLGLLYRDQGWLSKAKALY
ncbi:hypothetical protein Sste5346_006924 [Sporothrix stenoceras]|uniref:PNPLA domain-containing protein n=1 Tax=Sporothrix stenoceras TaxID=5173 RepID=A0ABR3YZ96_9PEZI